RPWLAAAAAAMVVGALGLVLLRSPGALPPEVAYSVEVRGLAEVRDVPSSQDPEASTADVPPEVAAYAGTMVRIVARPERSLALRLEPALYRLSEEGPEPVEPDRWELERRDGVFTLSGEAGALTGGTAGLHTLYLVLVRPGDLPEELGAWEASNLQERLAADGRRRVYPVILELLPEPADETIPFPGETP
ncbi:MAG: hypothetical protein SX243_24725, partial [Acidobacteriota bacterium]|nr:hypothetical protein [Acidobacteriota bacterium]